MIKQDHCFSSFKDSMHKFINLICMFMAKDYRSNTLLILIWHSIIVYFARSYWRDMWTNIHRCFKKPAAIYFFLARITNV